MVAALTVISATCMHLLTLACHRSYTSNWRRGDLYCLLRELQLLSLLSLRVLQALQLLDDLLQACSLLCVLPQHIIHFLPQRLQGLLAQRYGALQLVPVLLGLCQR